SRHRPHADGGAVAARGHLRERLDVYGLRSPVARLSLVGHLRALGQRLEPVADDVAVMDEEILADLVRCDEAVALFVVEPLNCSGGHVPPPLIACGDRGGALSNDYGRLAQDCRGGARRTDSTIAPGMLELPALGPP